MSSYLIAVLLLFSFAFIAIFSLDTGWNTGFPAAGQQCVRLIADIDRFFDEHKHYPALSEFSESQRQIAAECKYSRGSDGWSTSLRRADGSLISREAYKPCSQLSEVLMRHKNSHGSLPDDLREIDPSIAPLLESCEGFTRSDSHDFQLSISGGLCSISSNQCSARDCRTILQKFVDLTRVGSATWNYTLRLGRKWHMSCGL